ncbi:molecular chaperone [Bradyrhizobium diazoefficiens USDA 110]|uniref:Guanidinium exporter n=3 Tax=Bradyrhizobium diazoefficiens TaxID=1355477 RepID=Q89MZ8_BRADU|nr:quaternary ammonium compound-resistance protein SugE [Bradyrhizobium diazoefficiens]QBP22813.1 quaternary ammonium compound-resistance protein SugE [Bradyrhizobium diazoefficiens]BAC49309.1 molecular chaperone [Bradyrhizobium diazoefficiens USDA 110]
MGRIKPDVVIAEPFGQPHIAVWEGRPSYPPAYQPRGRPCLEWRVVMAWSILFVAGLLEITWAIGLKYTEGFTRLVPSVITLAAMAGSVILLGLALKSLPVGTAYAVWTGIGAVGTATLGIILFGEPATALRLASIGLIVAGIIGLKLVT